MGNYCMSMEMIEPEAPMVELPLCVRSGGNNSGSNNLNLIGDNSRG
jgi:hypothetical protein